MDRPVFNRERWVFTYKSGPLYHRTKCVRRIFRNAGEADLFVQGMRRGGAIDVNSTFLGRCK